MTVSFLETDYSTARTTYDNWRSPQHSALISSILIHHYFLTVNMR
jgi:hypothetical protein